MRISHEAIYQALFVQGRGALRIGIITDIAINRMAILTDGLERLALDFARKAAHGPFFRSMFGPVASSACVGRNPLLSAHLADFLSCDSVNARTDDDKTLVVAALQWNGPVLLCAGIPVATEERIGRGGEGEVYAVRGDTSRAIKLYLQPDATHEAKVRAMITARLADKCARVAFPLQIVHRADGSLGGFTMRRVSDSQPIFELFASRSRRERFPRANWAFLVRIATNVARVVAQVHASGAVIGDINSAGFLVSQCATVTLIDADSFQVAGHRCRVGMPECTPSELQGMRFGEVDRTVDRDAFGLAVMIFQLLALGRHPYAGVRNGRSIPLETAITQGRFAYLLIRNVGSMPPPAALTLRDLPLGIRMLFERAFALRMGPRPTAQEWVSELAVIEAGLVRCLNNSAHIIPTLATPCPWCGIEKVLGQSLFPASRPGGSAPQPVRTDLHREVARIVQYAKGYAREDIQPLWRRCDVVPSKAAVKLLGQDLKVPAGPIAALQIQISLANQRSTRVFLERYNAAQAAAALVLDRWRIDLGVWEVNTRIQKLQQNLIGWDRLRASTPVLLAQVTEGTISGAAIERMRTMPLDTAGVPGIGENPRSHLVRHGVATAADVGLSTIANLGEARSAAVLLWRDRIMVEAQRSVAGNRQRLDGDIAAGMASVGDQIAKAKDALRAQCADIEHRLSNIRKRVWLIDRKVEDSLHDRDQAAMDLKLLGIDSQAWLALSKALPPPAQTAVPPKAKKKPKTAKRQPVVCPACAAPMIKRWANGAQGSNKLFLGCSTYPRCTGSRTVHRELRSP